MKDGKTSQAPEKMLYTVKETAEVLGISANTLYQDLMHRPGFPVVRIGPKCIRISNDGLERWIAAQMQNGERE